MNKNYESYFNNYHYDNHDFINKKNFSKKIVTHKFCINDWVILRMNGQLVLGQITAIVPDEAQNKAGAYVVHIKDSEAVFVYEEEITGRVLLNYQE